MWTVPRRARRRTTTVPCSRCEEFEPAGLDGPEISIIPPSIDPLSAKNQWMDPETVLRGRFIGYGVQWNRPIVTQVSRFDPCEGSAGRDRRLSAREAMRSPTCSWS